MKTLGLPMYRSYLWNIMNFLKGIMNTWFMLGIAKISIAAWTDVLRWNNWSFIAMNVRLEDVEFARVPLSYVTTTFGFVRTIEYVIYHPFVLLFGKRWAFNSSSKRSSKTLRAVLAITWKRSCNRNWTQSTTSLDEEENSLRDKHPRKCNKNPENEHFTKVLIFF